MLCCRSFNASPTSASPLSTDILHCLHVRTLAMVKPDALKNFGAILGAVEAAGFTVGRLRMCQLTPAIAQGFYAVHADRPFFGPLTEFMSSGRIVAMELVAPGEYPPFKAPCSQAPSSTTPACIISSEHCPSFPPSALVAHRTPHQGLPTTHSGSVGTAKPSMASNPLVSN